MSFHSDGRIGDEHPLWRFGSRLGAVSGANRAGNYKTVYEMVNHKSGLLGVSEISSDMRDLLAQEAMISSGGSSGVVLLPATKWIGSFAAALADWIRSCSGGIGEMRPASRANLPWARLSGHRTK